VAHGAVDLRAVHALHVHHDAAVVEQQYCTGLDIVHQFRVIEADMVRIAHLAFDVEKELLARLQQHLAAGELADPDFRPLQIGHHADRATDLRRCLRERLDTCPVIVRLAMREVESHHVDTRFDEAGQCGEVARGGAERCNDFSEAVHGGGQVRVGLMGQSRARRSSMSTAGSVFPSRNSRKAPPPVEM
jgi:hypothetical protein